jgi:hypothetical protein
MLPRIGTTIAADYPGPVWIRGSPVRLYGGCRASIPEDQILMAVQFRLVIQGPSVDE